MKQTFIIQHWYGAPTYIEAARRDANEGYNRFDKLIKS